MAGASSVLRTGDPRLEETVARLDDRLTVVGQVRIDARAELIDALRGAGRPATATDADVMLFARAWEAWGDASLARLLGDYSVVVRDAPRRTLTLARDPLGIRLLFYARNAERVVASNTLSAVLAARGVSRALNDDAIADFIATGMNEDLARTTFRDVERVPPGHFLRLHAEGREELVRYWSLPEQREQRRARPRDYADGFRDALRASVRDRLRTESVSVLMSGGLDSTSLAAIARELLSSGNAVHAVTVDLPTITPTHDASRATLVAYTKGLRHTVINADPFGYTDGVGGGRTSTPEPYDEPDMDTWMAMLRAAASTSRVVLYGEDPDTLLAPPDWPHMLRASTPWRLARDIGAYLVQEHARPHLGVRASMHAAMGRSPDAAPENPPWLNATLRLRRAERLRVVSAPDHPHRPTVARRLAHPLWQSLLESLDVSAHGLPIDVRLPFLDQRVIAYALSVPPIPMAQDKRLLRDAMDGLLPDEVRLAAKEPLTGFAEARVAQWWSRGPAPFIPSDVLRRYVDVSALPPISTTSDAELVLQVIRLRILDRWLRASS